MALICDTLLLDVGMLAAVLAAVIYMYYKHSFAYWKKRNVPYAEPSFPFGNLADRVLGRESLGKLFQNLYNELQGHRFGGTYNFTKPGFIFRDPDLIRSIIVKDFSHFHDRGIRVNEEVDPLSGHLFALSGVKWRNLRVKLTPTFTSGKMKMMFQTLVDCGVELGNVLDEFASKGEVVEIKDILARYSTDIISSCAFGIQCNCLKDPDAEFRKWGRKFFEPSRRRIFLGVLSIVFPKVVDALRIPVLDNEVSTYFLSMVKETVKYREENNVKRNDFMQLLIQLKNKGVVDADDEVEQSDAVKPTEKPAEKGLSINSLAAQAFVFFIAGFETSSTTMTFCLYELALNPDIQERVRDEINNVLEKHGGSITYDAIMEMVYLDKVVSETLRKYPPVPILNREVTKEYRIPESDVVLEKGLRTIIPVWAIHHDPKHYPDPERFDPERFSEEEKAKRHQYVYLPFGEGPRICIGMRFGLMQTKIGLISLLSKYRFSVSEKTPIPVEMEKKSFTLSPAGGMWLKINKC